MDEKTKTLEEANAFFDDYFENMNLNSDMEKIYQIINDDDLQDDFDESIKLTNIRNNNHKRYYDINILKIKSLPSEFKDVVDDILKLYSFLDSKELLEDNIEDAKNHEKILNSIFRRINRLEQMIKTTIKELTIENDKKEENFTLARFTNLDIDEKAKEKLIELYNELILYNSFNKKDLYSELENQIIRNNKIREILKILNIEEENKLNIVKKDKLKILNEKIDIEIAKYKQKIHYLEDLIMEGSKHTNEFNDFREFCNKLMAYDDTNYSNAKQTYEVLSDDNRFKILTNNFESLFIQEREDNKKEEKFIYEKFGIKNIKTSLSYITANYMNFLNEEDKNIIEYLYNEINSENYDLNKIENLLSKIVKDIWKNTITDVYSFNPGEDFYFICTNNQFRDAKYQTILITKNELSRVEDYLDYQIGFICGYNDNIMYITENEDIMTVEFDDMSSLKTPLQLEQEFINFKVCNRIALNGYKTRIDAVYIINDGNIDMYMKALELANMYKLPLIELKKDK